MIAVALKGARSIKEQSQVHELMNIIFSSGQRQTEEGEGEGRKGRWNERVSVLCLKQKDYDPMIIIIVKLAKSFCVYDSQFIELIKTAFSSKLFL